jgi:predicted amidohydrolase YtcJ
MKKILLIVLLISSCTKNADLVVTNANIYTADNEFSIMKSMAIKDGKIVEVSKENLDKFYNTEEILNAEGKTILPGLIDSHCHFYGLGEDQLVVDLRETKSFEEIVDRLIIYNKKNKPSILRGRGWDQNDWEIKDFPDNKLLNKFFKDKIVVLERVDGHAYIVNDYALEKAEITNKTKLQGGTVILKSNKPSGVLIDSPMRLIDNILPEKNLTDKTTALQNAEKICFENGLTTVSDAGLGIGTINLIDSLQQNNELKINIYAMVSVSKKNINYFKNNGKLKTDRLNVRSFKVYGDGALGSRGAALKEPYSDDPHNHGKLSTSIDDVKYYAKNIKEIGFQMNTHAIGDSTAFILLNEYNKVLSDVLDPRWRIEHSQVIDKKDFNLYNEKVLPSIQPTHATSDMYWAEDRLGERVKGAYAFKDLLKYSKRVALGTDFPVEKVNPFHTFYSSVARKDLSGYPDLGFQMENSLSREETLKGMTIWGAYFNFEENEKGSLESGKIADFILIDRDIMKVDIDLTPETKVLKTYVHGELVYSK